MRWLIVISCSASCWLPAQTTLYERHGGNDGSLFGASVDGAGDVDGDGFDDWIVGAPLTNAGGGATGRARVFSGRSGVLLLEVAGTSVGDEFGQSVAGVGDANGDGRADVAVGSPGESNAGAGSGSVRLYSGANGALIWRIDGGAAGDRLGQSIHAAGDVNGDGFDDVVVGAPGSAGSRGMASVRSGRTGAVLHTWNGIAAGDELGTSVAGIGDMDGDERPDIAVGAPGATARAGRVTVFSGSTGSVLRIWNGANAGDELGAAVARVGDLNGDGRAEILAGSPRHDAGGVDAGRAVVFSGSDGSVLRTFDGAAAGDLLGSAIAGAGDVNGDDVPDLVIGAPLDDSGGLDAGSIRVRSGRDGSSLAFIRGTAGDRLGAAVGFAGDANRNHFADIVIGVPRARHGVGRPGAARVITTPPFAGMVPGPIVYGEAPGDGQGGSAAVAGIGDVNGDGHGDWVFGLRQAASGLGRVRMFSGLDGSVLRSATGTNSYPHLGTSANSAGDVNGDSVPDLVVGGTGALTMTLVYAYVLSGADGSLLHAFYGPPTFFTGAVVDGAGDVDRDGVPDLVVGWENEAKVFSGRTGATLHAMQGNGGFEAFGASVTGVGDADADGYDDFAVAAVEFPFGLGFIRVYSGFDGSVLRTLVGNGGSFGVSMDAGDFDDDGVLDVAVGATGGSYVAIYSGRTGALLRTLSGMVGMRFGWSVKVLGDVDGDGAADLAVGAPVAGQVQVFSGRTWTTLATFSGQGGTVEFGKSVGAASDVNRDGLPDLVVAAPGDSTAGASAGSAQVFLTTLRTDPGAVRPFGAGCAASGGALPRMRSQGSPRIGRSFDLGVASAPPNAPGALHIDVAPQAIDLGLVGFPPCTLRALPILVLGATTSAGGAARRTIAVPSLPSMVGQRLFGQWLVLELAAGRITATGGIEITFGRP